MTFILGLISFLMGFVSFILFLTAGRTATTSLLTYQVYTAVGTLVLWTAAAIFFYRHYWLVKKQEKGSV